MFTNTFFEERLESLLSLADRVDHAFRQAGLDYRIVGGLATYLYVEESAPDAGRLTPDIDIIVCREDLDKIAAAVEPFGLKATGDVLLQVAQPTRRAVHLVFSELGAERIIRGLRVAALMDLVRMKLTSFRLKDQVHIQDLDEAGLVTSEIEAGLTPVLRQRLADVRARY